MRNQITVLSLDLGMNLGWSRCVCTLRPTLHINAVDHGTVYLDALATERMKKEYSEVFSRHRVRMNIYEETLRKFIDVVKFDSFVTEDVFCNPTRINSFRSLAIYMETLERLVNNEKQKRLYTVTPTMCKQVISGFGHSDKTQVQSAIMNNKAITMKHPSNATEHEFDSVAICYSYVSTYLLTLV